MIGYENEEEKLLFFDIRFYLELYVDYINNIWNTRLENDNSKRTMSFLELFEKHIMSKHDDLKEYNPEAVFKTMIMIFNLVSGFYMLSLANDEMLKKIDDAYLKKIEGVLKGIFVDKSYCNQFDNRQIVVYLRNALSHTENGKLYKALNARTIEIKLDHVPSKNKTPMPFHVVVSTRDIHIIANHLRRGVYTYLIPTKNFTRSNLYDKSQKEIADTLANASYYKGYTRFDTNKELIEKVKNSFHANPDTYTEEEQSNDLLKLVEDGIIDNKSFKYDNEQIAAFLACNSRIHELGFKESALIDPFDFVLRISDFSMYPHPVWRLEEMRMLVGRTISDYGDPYNTIEKVEKKLNEYAMSDPLAYMTNKDIFEMFPEFQILAAQGLYYYYVFGHMLPSERLIVLNDKTYDLDRIRDSFIHGTWFSYYDRNGSLDFLNNFKYSLYDCNNGQKNEGNWNWKSSIMPYQELRELSDKVVEMKEQEFENNNSKNVLK